MLSDIASLSDLASLSELLHNDGAVIALLAYFFRGVVDAVFGGVSEAIGFEHVKTSIKDATRACLSCSSCRASQEPAEKGAAVSAEEQRRRDEIDEAQTTALVPSPASEPRVPGVTIGECCSAAKAENVSWEHTLAKTQRGACRGVVEAAVRFLFWHGLQPGVYLAALYVYWGELGWWQHLFGGIVGVREVLYLAGTVGVAVIQPSFLLVDVVASWKEAPGWVVMYVLAPEKMVFQALAMSPKIADTCWAPVIGGIGLAGTILTDLCAIGALAAALHSGVTPPALMVGYGMTTLAAVTVVHLFFCNGKFCGLVK